jgi:chromosome segregation ATPase
MVLALTVPPSLAFVIGRLANLYAAEERKVSEEQVQRIAKCEERLTAVDRLEGWHAHHEPTIKDHANRIDALRADAMLASSDMSDLLVRLREQDAELKRLNEQLTSLSERVYR